VEPRWNPRKVVGATGFEPATPCGQAVRVIPGGRTWWAHLEFTRINIELIILRKKMEELMNIKGVGEKSFLKPKAMVTVAPDKTDSK
jgi:hypothetical protein